mgnify:CR=1 FL=1
MGTKQISIDAPVCNYIFHFQMSLFCSLLEEILVLIFGKLNLFYILNVKQTCHRFHDIVTNQTIKQKITLLYARSQKKSSEE